MSGPKKDLSWNHCTSTPHKAETNGIAERAVSSIKVGTSAVLLQSGLDEKWSADSMECCTYLRNIQDLVWWENTICKTLWRTSAKDQWKNPSIWKESLTWIVPRIRSGRGGIWKGETMFADIEELETMDTSEIYAKRLNAKELIFPKENGKCIFPAADGRINLSGGDQELRTPTLIREHPVRGESQRDFPGESEGSLPQPQDSFPDAGEARTDFWSISGNFIYRLHVELHKDDTCGPAERLTKRQATSRPDHLWPDLWRGMSKNAKLREKHKCAIEKPKLDNARRLRGIYFIDPEDMEFKEIIKNARRKLETPMEPAMPCKTCKKSMHGETRSKTHDYKSKFACILEASESTRLRMEESLPNYHEDVLPEKGTIHYSITIWYTNLFLCLKQWRYPQQKQQWIKIVKNLKRFQCGTKQVRNKSDVIDAARKGRKVHFASLMNPCHLKNAESETNHQKYKCRIVLRGDIVTDDSGSYAVFTEQGSAASQMTTAKVMDIISRLSGCLVYHDTNGPNHGPVWKTICPFWTESVRSSIGRTIVRTAIWKSSIWTRLGKVLNWECFLVNRARGLFLSVYVDDIKLAGKTENINPTLNILMKDVDWDNQHHSSIMFVWVALKENVR